MSEKIPDRANTSTGHATVGHGTGGDDGTRHDSTRHDSTSTEEHSAEEQGEGQGAEGRGAITEGTEATSTKEQRTTVSHAFNTRAWLTHYNSWTPPEIDTDALFHEGTPASTSTDASHMRTLVDIFNHATTTYADTPAFTFFGKATTYAEYGQQVARTAAALRQAGVRRGEYVAIAAPNCPQALIAFYAVLSVGATPALHNPLYTASELTIPFNNHKARVGFFWDKAIPVAQALKEKSPLERIIAISLIDSLPALKRLALRLPLPIPALQEAKGKLSGSTRGAEKFRDFLRTADGAGKMPGRRLGEQTAHTAGAATTVDTASTAGAAGTARTDASSNPTSTDSERIKPEDPALILYTSGTTGVPKGAVLTHRNLISNLHMGRSWVEGLGEGPQPEKMLAALPLFHAYGLTMNITMAPVIGGTIQLLPAPEMNLIMEILKKDTPTWLPGVPTLYEKIMDAAQERGVSIHGIRSSFSGASSLPASIVQRWEKLTGGRIVEGYGLTETSPIIAGNPMGKGREGYIGVPFPSTDIRIADPTNPAVTLPDGHAGELLVRGPQVFSGYLDMPEQTKEAFCEGWFRTGDMAVMEPDGYLRIVSRIKEMIITGGFNIYPAEVEAVLATHAAVLQASVVGLDRGDGSETVCAAVVLAPGRALDDALIEELKKHCHQSLTNYKVPKIFQQFEKLPADQLGKVRRAEVRTLVQQRAGQS